MVQLLYFCTRKLLHYKKLNLKIMAKPIKETPFLYGKDADTFVKENKEVKKASKKEKEEINRNYQTLMKLAEFGA